MTVLQEFAFYQALLLSVLIDGDEEGILARIAPLYALNDKEQALLHDYLCNDTFQRVCSSDAVILHENYIESFCTDPFEFGCNPSEWDALEIKRNAYTIIENIGLEMGDLIDILVTESGKNDKLSVTLALFYYLRNAKPEVFIPLLRRAEAHGKVESTVLLMAFEKDRRSVLLEKLYNNKVLIFDDDNISDRLSRHYGIGIPQ